MNRYDATDPDVSAWFDAEALAPVPAERRDHALATVLARRPRPAGLARIGSHWVAEPSPVGEWLGRRGITMPAGASTSAIVLLVVALTLLGVAMIVGGRLLQATPADGRLLYQRNGDLYLADADGGNPVKVGPGGMAGGMGVGLTWAPDGRHFTYWGYGDGDPSEFRVSDADGRMVHRWSRGGGTLWSPDSTRLARWTDDHTNVRIYAIDGSILSELALPAGHTDPQGRLTWAPDGRSVWVLLCAVGGSDPPCENPEPWELPIDGSAPRRVATDLAPLEVSGLTFSPDGTRLAFVAREAGTRDDHVLYVAEPDGTNRTPVIRSDDGPSIWIQHLAWSPGSDAIAYRNQAAGGSQIDTSQSVKVVDIATGTARTLVPNLDWDTELLQYSWSPDGTRLLLWGGGSPWRDGLWTIAVAGGDPTLLVEDAREGEWQPVPARR